METEHSDPDSGFSSIRTYPRALARARYLGFDSVADAIKKKLAEGDPVSTVADKLDVSWNTLYAWIKTAGIRVAPNPRKRNWWLTTEKYYPVGRLKR
jgi:hypothetical protein